MSRLWFDPSADIVKHDPPRKPLDPSRPIKKAPAPIIVEVSAEQAAYAMFDWSNFVGGIYVAPETDPA